MYALNAWNLTLGSWIKDWPDLAFGGSSPVVATFKDSIIVCMQEVGHNIEFTEALRGHLASLPDAWGHLADPSYATRTLTVFPAPFGPTISVRGLKKVMTA